MLQTNMGATLKEAKDKPSATRTVETLRLDVPSALAGKHWLLLPEGFRDQDAAQTYPLPSNLEELQKLIVIPVQPQRHDGGTVYLKRCIKLYKQKLMGKQARAVGVVESTDKMARARAKLDVQVKQMKAEVQEALNGVKAEAEKAIASMHDLFSLGRKGIEGQMKAHLDHTDWQGEAIDARAFRECFRMVTQTVKGLGLPSDEQRHARDAIMEELAAAIGATQEVVEFSEAPGSDDETEH